MSYRQKLGQRTVSYPPRTRSADRVIHAKNKIKNHGIVPTIRSADHVVPAKNQLVECSSVPLLLMMLKTSRCRDGVEDDDDNGEDVEDAGDDDVDAVVAGSVRVVLGLLHHGVTGGTALQEVRQAGLPVRTEPRRLL